MAVKKDVVVEVIDETEDNHSSGDKVYRRTNDEFGVLIKAAEIYFSKLHDLHQASESKRRYGSATDCMTNLNRAHRAAWKHIVDNSETHKDNEKIAKKYLPDSTIDDFHRWLDDSDD